MVFRARLCKFYNFLYHRSTDVNALIGTHNILICLFFVYVINRQKEKEKKEGNSNIGLSFYLCGHQSYFLPR